MDQPRSPSSERSYDRLQGGSSVPPRSDSDDLVALVDRALDVPSALETAKPFLPELVAHERSIRAVLLYGSCLWPSVRGESSTPDFIVIVDSLRAFHGSLRPALLGAVLPPTVYRLRNGDAYAKLSVATAKQLRSQCAASASDLHLAGRLSKRVALLWCRDADARALVVAAQSAALRTLAPLALARLTRCVALDDFIYALLRLSYESEVRIVEPNKVAALFAAEREHYRAVGHALLRELGGGQAGAGPSELILPEHAAASRAQLARRLRRSRRRALLRFPKYLVTYDGWLDYLLKKLARSGSPVVLTNLQRRHPLVFALPVLYELATSRRLA
jgi:Phosphatidate cytidylyltransferase, mitochondrial